MQDIQTFFSNYARAHLEFSPKRLVKFFQIPCLINDPNGQHLLPNSRSIIKYEKAFLMNLQQHGMDQIEATLIASHAPSDGVEFASINYKLYVAQDLFADFDYHYGVTQIENTRLIAFAHAGQVHFWLQTKKSV